MAAKEGVYCGPLRLLAMEIYDECNASGTFCNLYTGTALRSHQSPYEMNTLICKQTTHGWVGKRLGGRTL